MLDLSTILSSSQSHGTVTTSAPAPSLATAQSTSPKPKSTKTLKNAKSVKTPESKIPTSQRKRKIETCTPISSAKRSRRSDFAHLKPVSIFNPRWFPGCPTVEAPVSKRI